MKNLKIIRIRIPASIISVGRKISTEVSGIINLSWIETGTSNTVRNKNLSMARKARTDIIRAGGINHRNDAPLFIRITDVIRKPMLRTKAIRILLLSLLTIKYFDLFSISHH
jgi:hypothetical protein